MSMNIEKHPDETTLMSYSAGSLSAPLSAVVAAHVSMCRHCRAALEDLDLLGATLLSSSPADGEPIKVPARPVEVRIHPDRAKAHHDRLPLPIARKYGLSLDTVPWRWLGPGAYHYRLPLPEGVSGDLRLLKIAPGAQMPQHGHSGTELTLVLEGAFSDSTGEYQRGDLQDVDEEVDHCPVADKATGCVCLIAMEGPAKFQTLIGRLMQPWTGM